MQSLVYQFSASDEQVLESIRIELIRIMSLYITGYDAPCQKTGIAESVEALKAMQHILSGYLNPQEIEGRELSEAVQKTIRYLQGNIGFDSFDRLTFLSVYAIPLEHKLHSFIQKKGFAFCSVPNLDYSAPDLFSGEVRMPGKTSSIPMILLGKKLFSEKKLSGNSSRSCASCHQPQKYYSDQLNKNLALDQGSELKRNTPTLLYAGFQSAQFWDGRAKTVGEQILDVLTNPQEMNGRIPIIERKLNQNIKYRIAFRKAFCPISHPSTHSESWYMHLAYLNKSFAASSFQRG